MIHELTKELYKAAHERGYIINLRCAVLTDGTGYVNVVAELYSTKEASHIMTLDLKIVEKSPDSKKAEYGLVVNHLETFMEDLDYDISMSIQAWMRSTIMTTINQPEDVLYRSEKEMNDNQCTINSVLIMDIASVVTDMNMEFDGDVVFPKMEYNFTIGSRGYVILKIDYECVSDALEKQTNGGSGVIVPKLVYSAYNGAIMNEWLKLAGLSLVDPNGIVVFDKKIEIAMSRIVARTMQPLYDEIFKAYQRVKIGGVETK